MVDRLRAWLDDDEPIELWSTRRLYYAALDYGVTDRRVIANAMALVDAANAFAKCYPDVSYDQLVNALLLGMQPELYLVWGVQRWKRRVALYLRWSRLGRTVAAWHWRWTHR